MTKSARYKIATAITGTVLAIGGLFNQHQKDPNTILDKDTNIQYTYTDQNGMQVYGVLDDTQTLSARIQSDSIIEKTSMFIAWDDEPIGPDIVNIGVNSEGVDQRNYLPIVMNGSLFWPANGDRSARWIPAPGGVSVGHPDITYGTIGDQVTYNGNTNCFITNAHVAGGLDGGKVGDRIVQPGPHHGGTKTIGYVVAMVTPLANVTNSVDIAVVCGERGSVYPDIYGIGQVNGVYEDPYIGMVATMCAVSGCHVLTLEAMDVTVKIGYYTKDSRLPKMRTFAHQMMWSGKGAPGDSGGDIVTDHKMVSELFAGNEDENRVMGNDPAYLLKALPGLVP